MESTLRRTWAEIDLDALAHNYKTLCAHIGPNVKIKAAGGIANLQDAEDFINLGASRLGTSRIVKAVKAMEK